MNLEVAPEITTGSAILMDNVTNILIENMNIDYSLDEPNYAYVIYAANANNLTIVDSEFFLEGKTTGKEINNIIRKAFRNPRKRKNIY